MFSARWWSYLTPPADHPWLGDTSLNTLRAAGLADSIVEQQVYVGATVLLLGAVALAGIMRGVLDRRERAAFWFVPLVASTAAICSLSPAALLLHRAFPVFRSFARFGGLVQAGCAIAAGPGLLTMVGRWPRHAPALIALAVVAVCVEYAPLPWRWRDVLPTQVHRWLTARSVTGRVLDCSASPPGGDLAMVLVFRDRLTSPASGTWTDCGQPDLAARAAAHDVTSIVVPGGTPLALAWAVDGAPAGLSVLRRFPGAAVYAVTARDAAPFVDRLAGCGAREWTERRTFCWAPRGVELTVRNLAGAPRRARLAIEIAAFPRRRVLTVKQDLQPADRLELAGGWYDYVLGPYEFPPGASSLSLLPDGEPILIDDIEHTGDRRAASLALGRWHWLPASD